MQPFERSRPESCLSDLVLDRLASEASGHPHADECDACRARLQAIIRERSAFMAEAPALVRTRRRSWPVAIPIALAAGLSALFVRSEDGTRTKGSAEIGFYVKHGDVVRKGADGEVLAPKDSIRFSYTAHEARHLAILSVDPEGEVSVYYPTGATRPEAPGTDVLLPLSTALDDTVGRERIWALFCEGPIDLDRARSLVAARAPPGGCTASELSFEKRR
jgi:hypothetical protein